MQGSTFLILMLTAIVVTAAVAKRFGLPYPIAFVIGGSLLAFVPNLPVIQLDPDWVFLIFLPPLLFSGGWQTDWQAFKDNARAIGLLAVGLVTATTVGVAMLTHALAPQLGWAPAFVLGAIVSPPDAVAAGAIFERFSVPRRIVAILDGEGLVNDASALVFYNFAVAAVLTGTFSLARAGISFFIVSIGGIALGLAFGYTITTLILLLRRFELSDYLIDSAISLLAPYVIYLSCTTLGVSGVLGVVTAGVFSSRRAEKVFEPDGRLVANAVWELMVFLLNGFVFVLIGLQLRAIVDDPAFALREIWLALAISLLVIAIRIVWVYPSTYLPRIIWKSIREREGMPAPNYVFVVAWSGMRGIVSLAAALAVPQMIRAGAPFPGRSEIIFVTFCVIFATLVFQGLSLIPLLKILRIEGDDLDERETEVRIAALRAGMERMRELEGGFATTADWEVEGRILGEYEYRIAHLSGHLDGTVRRDEVAADHMLQQEALRAERREILRLRNEGEIPDEIYRKIQYDLDLADERLR